MPRLVAGRAGPGGEHAELHHRSTPPWCSARCRRLIFAAGARTGLPVAYARRRARSSRSSLWATLPAAGAAAEPAPADGERRAGRAGAASSTGCATSPPRRCCCSPSPSTSSRWCWPCRGRSSRRWPQERFGGGARSAGSTRAIAIGSVLGRAHLGLDRPGPPAGAGAGGRGGRLGAGGGRGRAGRPLWLVVLLLAVAGAADLVSAVLPAVDPADVRAGRDARAGCRACSSPWWPAARAWATCGPARWPPWLGADRRLGRRRARRAVVAGAARGRRSRRCSATRRGDRPALRLAVAVTR